MQLSVNIQRTLLVVAVMLPWAGRAKNPILPLDEYIPDVEAQVFTNAKGKERVYLYGSHDNYPSSTWCSFQYRVYSAPVDDLDNWTDHGVSFASRKGEGYRWNGVDADGVAWSERQLYAPDVEYAEGKYWLASCLAGGGLGMSVSDTPEGPFSPAVKICYDDTGAHLPSIDPSLFYDNGTMYLVWGQTKSFGAEGCVGVVLEKDKNGRTKTGFTLWPKRRRKPCCSGAKGMDLVFVRALRWGNWIMDSTTSTSHPAIAQSFTPWLMQRQINPLANIPIAELSSIPPERMWWGTIVMAPSAKSKAVGMRFITGESMAPSPEESA